MMYNHLYNHLYRDIQEVYFIAIMAGTTSNALHHVRFVVRLRYVVKDGKNPNRQLEVVKEVYKTNADSCMLDIADVYKE